MPTRIVTDVSRQNRASMGTRRRQRQRRAGGRIDHRLNQGVIHRARTRLACVFHLQEIRHAEACDVERGTIIAVPIVVAVVAIHPPSPFDCLFAIRWRTIRFRRCRAARTGMAGPARLFRVEPQANQMALVTQEPPNFPTYSRVITIISPSSTDPSSAPCRFQRL